MQLAEEGEEWTKEEIGKASKRHAKMSSRSQQVQGTNRYVHADI